MPSLRRRQWYPTPVLLPGKSHGPRSLVGCSPLVDKSWTRLSDFTFTFHFHALEKEMATHSSVLAWRIPGTAEPGGLPSMGLHRVGHDWSDLACLLYNPLTSPTWSFYHALEKEMAPHSSTLAWKIPWTEEPGRLQSMGSQRVGHDWVTSLQIYHHQIVHACYYL